MFVPQRFFFFWFYRIEKKFLIFNSSSTLAYASQISFYIENNVILQFFVILKIQKNPKNLSIPKIALENNIL